MDKFDKLVERLTTKLGRTVSRRDAFSRLWELGLIATGLSLSEVALPLSKAWGSNDCVPGGNCGCGPQWCGGEGYRCTNNTCSGSTCAQQGCWSFYCCGCTHTYCDCCCTISGSCSRVTPWCCGKHGSGAAYCNSGYSYCCTIVVPC